MGQKVISKKNKKKIKIGKASSRQFNTSILRIIFYVCLLALLAYPPFFRGMYFENEMLPNIVATSLVFILWVIIKLVKNEPVIIGKLDYGILSLAGAYFISTLFAVNVRTSIYEVLKYLDFAFIYLMVSRIVKTKKEVWILLNILVLSSVGVALIGLGSAAGIINYNGSWVGGRINSTFQYPNTTASFLMAFLFVNLALLSDAKNRYLKAFYGVLAFTQFYAFIFTLSRGAWVMFFIFGMLLMLLMPKGKKFEVALYFTGIVIASILPIVKFNSTVNGQMPSKLVIWYIVGTVLSLILTYLISFIIKAINEIKIKTSIMITAAVIAIAIIFIAGDIVFTAQVPLSLNHGANEADSGKTVTRFINNIDPGRQYVLKYTVKAQNTGNKDWAYGIIIDSRNENDQSQKLKEFYDKNSFSGEKTIEFKTLSDTKRLAISFTNNFKDTSVTFDKAEIYPKNNPQDVQNIILKYKYLPENIASRIQDINFTTQSSSQRMQFYKDGLKIFKAYPLFGAGGGAWTTLYFKYQSYLYWTTQTHSYFMQVLLDTGLIGFAALIFLLIALLMTIIRVYKSDLDINERVYFAAVVTAIVSIFAHAAMDFDLSLAAVSISLWALIGLIRAMDLEKCEKADILSTKRINNALTKNNYINYGILSIAIIVMFLSASFSTALSYAQNGDSDIKAKNIAKAEADFKNAVSYDPWNAKYRMAYGQILLNIGNQTRDFEKIKKAEDEIKKAADLEPYNFQINAQVGAFYLSHGQIDKGIQYVKKAVDVQPLRPENYQQLADAYNKVGMFYLQKGDKERAKEYLKKAVDVGKMYNKVNSKSLEPNPMMDQTKKIIEDSNKALEGIH
ncbi:O-antigen ligase family protein [Aceticella autotrophica]|uniref:O-antigen ligase family protein n=1 Tax=Aceticella autotrophica TaxID=2755338 RepID=A0A975AWH1_9THEO|nr:O-antigen ligase family protein [Aceticella autotrophica]QSZ27754.1 O-antigen ligase family protein [Aceticella autotrophica]